MKDTDRQTRSHLMRLFEENGFHPRTDLGQNFLIDLNLVEFLVAAGELSESDVVLGAGRIRTPEHLVDSSGSTYRLRVGEVHERRDR